DRPSTPRGTRPFPVAVGSAGVGTLGRRPAYPVRVRRRRRGVFLGRAAAADPPGERLGARPGRWIPGGGLVATAGRGLVPSSVCPGGRRSGSRRRARRGPVATAGLALGGSALTWLTLAEAVASGTAVLDGFGKP